MSLFWFYGLQLYCFGSLTAIIMLFLATVNSKSSVYTACPAPIDRQLVNMVEHLAAKVRYFPQELMETKQIKDE